MPTCKPFHLHAQNLTVVRGGRTVLDRLTFRLSAGSRLAIVGENGRGKTTLLHTLTGRIQPDGGTITSTGSIGIAEQSLDYHDDATVGTLTEAAIEPSIRAVAELDAAALALTDDPEGAADRYAQALETAEQLDAWDAERRVDIALEALEACADRSRKLGTLSVGQRYRVRLACLLGATHDLLLLDEPTNHLDHSGLEFLAQKIREHAGGVALVSHDRTLLKAVATDFLDLDPTYDGLPRVYGGGYAGWQEARRRERRAWEQEYQRQLAERARLEDSLSAAQERLSTGWRPDKGTGKHTRQSRAPGVVQQFKRRAEDLEAHRVTVPQPPLSLRFPQLHAKPTAAYLTAEALQLQPRLTEPVDLVLRGGQKILLTGPNGAGKSTLLSLLASRLSPNSGVLRVREGARVSLVGQENPQWDSSRTAQEVFEAHQGRLVGSGRIRASDTIGLGSLGILPAEAYGAPVKTLSQGQQRRLELAMRLAERPHVLLLDEPTNHLAISLVDELTAALEATAAAVVIATHDRQLIADLAHWQQLVLVDSARPHYSPGGDSSCQPL